MILTKLNDEFFYHFFNGTLYNAYDYLGAHVYKDNGEIKGVEFLVYAPNANNISIICEHNGFKPIFLKEIKRGFFYLYINKNIEGKRYKYIINTKQNKKLYKADPYAFSSEIRPGNSSIVYDLQPFNFYKKNIENKKDKPIVVYELHLSSWRKSKDNYFLSYLDIKDELIHHLKSNNFTHVEFLPIQEHPLDDSWGYMTTGYYAPTARHGSPIELMKLIDEIQRNGIDVILDWVPGHICRDDFSLYNFDGSYLYEYGNEKIRENTEWGTANLDLSKNVVKNFLISNALYWIKYFNVDGFRVDAVNNLIYYLGNSSLGVNTNAIKFIQTLNTVVKKSKQNLLMFAEDSSVFPNVTKPIIDGGLGFDYKWNMGFMNDSLKYFSLSDDERRKNHNLLTFGFLYVFSEQFILAISHDEVVHLKKSLFSKMPGNYFEKFSNLKSYFGFMFTHPGKKLLFMGCEFAQDIEWNFKEQLKFDLYNNKENQQLNQYFKDITKLYNEEEILYKTDNDKKSVVFIDADNHRQSIYIFARVYNNDHIITILNASNQRYLNYQIGVLNKGEYIEVLNSDNSLYGGSNLINLNIYTNDYYSHNFNQSIMINIAPYSTIILKYKKN